MTTEDFLSDAALLSLRYGLAQRPRCAAGAALWLREPTGACLLAVGTNALLGNVVERRKVKVEARAALTERTAPLRLTANDDATLSETLWNSESDERRCARNEAT